MNTNTTSIPAVAINSITVDDIVNEVIKDNELAELAKQNGKGDTVASVANAKKGTYAMVNIHLMDYFVDAYNRVANLNNKTAWAEREVITATMESDYYKKAFGSDDAYAKEIGKSPSSLSKIKNSIKVRNEVERITGHQGYSTSFIDELISPFNKMKDSFAMFLRYSIIDTNTTVKEVREMVKHFNDVVAGKARPKRKGFFKVKAVVDGVETEIDAETESEYNARIEAERLAQQKTDDSAQQKTDDVTNEIKDAVSFLVENTNKMTVSVYGKKRGNKAKVLQIDTETMMDIYEILVLKGIITR